MFGDELTAALPVMRAHAESRMTSRATFYRATGRMPQDETTGLKTPEWEIVHVDLPCRFPPSRGGSSKSRTFNVGGAEVTLGVREIHVPYETTGLADGDLALVTTGRGDGSVWRLVDASPPADQATAYRLDVVAADRPEEW